MTFLPLNWATTKVFMRDYGSIFLAYMFIIILTTADNIENVFSLILISTPFLADTFICLGRRAFYMQNIVWPHRSHLYQRLHQAGLSNKLVSIIYLLWTLILSVSYLTFGINSLVLTTISCLVFGYLIDTKYAINFNFS
ncbi:hypothetical protein [Prochlorococcus sp. MIT 1011]|uniref:hypothetical protein n=1 Tax=Prochlorococcus sp. MIT 1011 TaxID=3082520 RepID=UPI0039B6331F